MLARYRRSDPEAVRLASGPGNALGVVVIAGWGADPDLHLPQGLQLGVDGRRHRRLVFFVVQRRKVDRGDVEVFGVVGHPAQAGGDGLRLVLPQVHHRDAPDLRYAVAVGQAARAVEVYR